MIVRNLATITPETTDQLINAIPFYKTIKQQDEHQYNVLLNNSRLAHYQPGEQILTKGQRDSWSYFLVKGQLIVSIVNSKTQPLHVNYITPGEVFGDLSMLIGSERSANVSVDPNSREAVVFGTDFSVFGALDNVSVITLTTKLTFYRHTVHSLRWKLDMYRSKYPDHHMASKHRMIKIYTGPKDTTQELKVLHDNAAKMAGLLIEWNQSFGSLSLAEGSAPPTSNLAI